MVGHQERGQAIQAGADGARAHGDALTQLSVAVFLQEYWAFAAQNVVDLCLTRLAESDAYLGVF